MRIFRRFICRGLKAGMVIVVLGYLVPERCVIPVKGATANDWNHNSFWAYPWGASVTHNGIDIFAPEGREVNSATSGLVCYVGNYGIGGKSVIVLGPKWRLHVYVHLSEYRTTKLRFIKKGKVIGLVGRTGNAANTPAHLHYGIITPIPYPWLFEKTIQGHKKMFFLNPHKHLAES